MRTEDFDFHLPSGSIAQRPVARGSSRLLCLDAPEGERHRRFDELPGLLRPGDLLVVNDTRVVPARLRARRLPGGGAAELLLIEPAGDGTWWALARPGRRLREETRLAVLDAEGRARVGARILAIDERRRRVAFDRPVEDWLDELGAIPLPPYVDREADENDRRDYQTVWAARPGAVAAPTAGLHFSPELLERLEESGIERTAVTLHVGPGTFRPVQADRVDDHRMDEERWEVPTVAASRIAAARAAGRRIVAVGTTVVRTLESAAREDGSVPAGSGRTRLFIRPGHRFRVVDALVTNFHLPRSTLLMLVAALAGRDRVLAAYEEAVARGYRFYSYGDAMLLERRGDGPAGSAG